MRACQQKNDRVDIFFQIPRHRPPWPLPPSLPGVGTCSGREAAECVSHVQAVRDSLPGAEGVECDVAGLPGLQATSRGSLRVVPPCTRSSKVGNLSGSLGGRVPSDFARSGLLGTLCQGRVDARPGLRACRRRDGGRACIRRETAWGVRPALGRCQGCGCSRDASCPWGRWTPCLRVRLPEPINRHVASALPGIGRGWGGHVQGLYGGFSALDGAKAACLAILRTCLPVQGQ
jgi:hypothetical protein